MAEESLQNEDNISEKVLRYETFLNETLKKDLERVIKERDGVYSDVAEYLQLQNTIQNIQSSKIDKQTLKTKVDLGCNFYVQANVPDPSKIFVCVGFGFFVEFTLSEALKFIEKKVAHLTERSDSLTKDAIKIKMHIRLLLEGLREIQGLDDGSPEKPRRDIF